MVAVEILSGVLQFAVHSLVQILKKGDSGRFDFIKSSASLT